MSDMTYGETLALFRASGYELVEMKDGACRVAICPKMGGRIVAASLWHEEGTNPFFVNPVDVKGGPGSEKLVFRGGLGGRDWLGPEGCGDMSFYFKKGPLTFENWYVNNDQSIPQLAVQVHKADHVVTAGEFHVPNLRGNMFDIAIEQDMKLLTKSQSRFGLDTPKNSLFVGFERVTSFTNIGKATWSEAYGFAMIWFLLMLRSSDAMYVLVPFKDGKGPEVIDYEFDNGPIPAERLMVRREKKYILFNADGYVRGKIGQTPDRATGVMYAVDLERGTLTVLKYDVDTKTPYLDNRWTQEAHSSGGDVMDSYNNHADSPTLPGRLFELEAVSPRLALAPGQKASMRTVTGFFHGDREMINSVVQATGGGDISKETFGR